MYFQSLPKLLDYFKDNLVATQYYANLRWGGNPTCPHCSTDQAYTTKRGYKCRNKECAKKFTVRTGTIFQNSPLSLRLWLAAIYLVSSHKKGVNSVQLSIDLGVTQKTAWFMLHRIREVLKDDNSSILNSTNPVEVDETYVGGREKNKHYLKRRSLSDNTILNGGAEFVDKKVVVGIIERGGKVALRHVEDSGKDTMSSFIKDCVPSGHEVFTDEYRSYSGLKSDYEHSTINHSVQVYVEGKVHTNTIENFWSVLKRGLYGVYISVSSKHLTRYLNEYSFRFNVRKMTNEEKFLVFLKQSGNYLSYKELIV